MQLPRDAGAFGRGGDLRLGVTLPLGPDGAFLQRGGVGPPVAHRVAEHPGARRGQQVGIAVTMKNSSWCRAWFPPGLYRTTTARNSTTHAARPGSENRLGRSAATV